MSFIDDWARVIQGTGGPITTMPGLSVDLASIKLWPSNEDLFQSYVDGGFRNPLEPLTDAWNFVYREGISEPIATVEIAARQARQKQLRAQHDNPSWTHYVPFAKDSWFFGEVPYLYDKDLWSDSYKRAQTTSIGQGLAELSAASAFNPDQEQARTFTDADIADWRKNSAAYNIGSGTADFMANFRLDPLNALGRGLSFVRQSFAKAPIQAGTNIANAMNKAPTGFFERSNPRNLYRRTESVLKSIKGKDASYIFNAVDGLRESTNGPALAAALAKAGRQKDTTEARLVLRLAYGDNAAIGELTERNAEIADLLIRANSERNVLMDAASSTSRWLSPQGMHFVPQNPGTQLKYLERYQNRLRGERDRLDFYTNVVDSATHRTLRATSRSLRLGDKAIRQSVVQPTMWNLPLRVVTGFGKQLPPRVISLDDPDSVQGLTAMFDATPGIDAAARNKLLNEYMEATSSTVKYNVALKAKSLAMAAKAIQHGYTKEAAEKIVNDFAMNDRRYSATWGLVQQRFSGTRNPATGEMADLIDAEDGTAIVGPILKPQTPNVVLLPDLELVDKALRRNKGVYQALSGWLGKVDKAAALRATGRDSLAAEKLLYGIEDTAMDALNLFHRWWKLAVLAPRLVSYPLRVLIDNDMRVWAKLGASASSMHAELAWSGIKAGARSLSGLTYHRAKAAHAADVLRADELQDELQWYSRRSRPFPPGADTLPADLVVQMPKETLESELQAIQTRLASVPKVGVEKVYVEPGIRHGEQTKTYRGVSYDGAFGGPDAQLNRVLASNGGVMDVMINGVEDRHYARSQQGALGYRAVEPNEPDHPQAWLHAINHQLRNDPMAMKLLAGQSEEAVLKWLKTTDEGRRHMKDIGFLHKTNLPRWVSNVKAMVDEYVPDAGWRKTVLGRDLRKAEVQGWLDAGGKPPTVHGAIIDTNLGRGPVNAGSRAVYKWMTLISTMPEQVLSRHPLYSALYQHRAEGLIDQILADPARAKLGKPADALDADDMDRLYKISHSYARNELKKTLWDITAYSSSAHALRFVSPFIHAWQETLHRWWNLAKDKPQIINYFQQAWQIPNKMGLVVDRNGSPVDHSEGISDDERIVLKLPAWMGNEEVKLSVAEKVPYLYKSSLSVALQGDPWFLPGTGPLMQVPLSQFANDHPQFEDTLKKFGLLGPQGAAKGVMDAVLPAYAKRWVSWFDEGKTQRDFAQDQLTIYREMKVDWIKAGSRGDWDTNTRWQEALDKTKSLYMMKGITSLLSPFTTQYNSRYQFYIDAYHRLQDQARKSPDDERTQQWVDDQFYAKYPEYFELVQPLGKANIAVPASVQGVNAAKKYAEEIARFPDLAEGIVSFEGEGAFSHAANQYEHGATYQPGNPQTMRTFKNPRQAQDDAEAKSGWLDFRRINNALNAVAQGRGLTSYRYDPELAQIHANELEKLAAKNAAWLRDYSSRDSNWFDRQLQGMTELAGSKRLQGRTDVKALRRYLYVRGVFEDILQERARAGGSANPAAKTNIDLMLIYGREVDKIREANTYFDEHWYMPFIDRDPMLTAIPEMQSA